MAGRILFPLIMLVFFVSMVAWAATVPVEPAPAVPGQRGQVVAGGDVIMAELTGWYGGATGGGTVFVSSQEERHNNLPYGSVQPTLQSQPFRVQIPANAGMDDDTFFGQFLGKRVGQSFTTERLAPASAFGDWQQQRTFQRNLQTLDVRVTLGGQEVPWRDIGFSNLTQYESFWARQGISTLSPGTEFPCEGIDRWGCRVAARDPAGNGTVTYDRVVEEGDAYSLGDLLGPTESALGFTGRVTVALSADGGRFDLRLDPVQGEVFQLRQGLGERLPRGTYRVTSIDETTFSADFSANDSSPPGLIGQHVWYEVVVVSIERPEAS